MSRWLVRFALPSLVAMVPSVFAQDPTGQGGEGGQTGQGGQSGQSGQQGGESRPPRTKPAGEGGEQTTTENKAALMRRLRQKEGKEDSPDGVAEGTGDAAGGGPPGVAVNALVFPTGFTNPRRLGPGESGDLYLRIDLRNNAVVPATPLRLEYQTTQGVLSLGNQELPQPRLRPTGKDRPVVSGFDDTFLIKVPISVDAGAKHGKFPFEGTLVLTVIDASTGMSSPETRVPISNFSVEVGPPMPRGIGVRPAKAVDPNGSGGEARRWTPILSDQSELGLSLAFDDSEVVCAGDSAVLLARLVIPVQLSVPRSTLRVGLKAEVAGVQAGTAELPEASGSGDALRKEALLRLPLKILAAAEEGDRTIHVQAQCAPVDAEGRPAPGGTVDAQMRFKVRRRIAAEGAATTETYDTGGAYADLQLGGTEKEPQTLWFAAAGAGGIGVLAVAFWLLRRRQA